MKRKGRLFAAVAFLLTVFTVTLAFQKINTVAYESDAAAIEAQILAMQNAYRTNAGLAPLTATETLMWAADVRAAEISGYFSHARPDGSPWWALAPDAMWGENLAYGYQTAEAAVNAWMSSPAHYYNIMNPEFHTCGIGVWQSGGVWYYAAEFGY